MSMLDIYLVIYGVVAMGYIGIRLRIAFGQHNLRNRRSSRRRTLG